jgi:hypothetical protein
MTQALARHRLATLLGVVALAGCADFETTGPLEAPVAGAQVVTLQAAANAIRDRYVVVLKPGAGPTTAQQIVATAGGVLHRRYSRALNGFAATIPERAIPALLRNPLVQSVAQDGVVRVSTVQSDPPWNLDRIDQRDIPLDDQFDYAATGAGVNVYVIDSGIRYDHEEFGGRASLAIDVVGGLASPGSDCYSHGTHVAGTIGGATYGVAKGVTLKSARVFDCAGNGTWSGVIAAVDWVTANHVKPAVANMSLGGSYYEPANAAVANSIAAGVVYAVAAGNENHHACLNSPASTPTALTVAASDINDYRASFSNWGSCVDLFAPGVQVESASHLGADLTTIKSGTSMASPHVAGVAALYLEGTPDATPADVASAILGSATVNRLQNIGPFDTPNALLFSPMTVGEMRLAVNPSSLYVAFLKNSGVVTSADATAVTFAASGTGAPKPRALQAEANIGTINVSVETQILLTNLSDAPRDFRVTTDRNWLSTRTTEGSLGGNRSAFLSAVVSSFHLNEAPGLYTGTIRVLDLEAQEVPLDIPVIAEVVHAPQLLVGARHTASGAAGSIKYYILNLPGGMLSLDISTSGGTGDVDLYVRYGQPPSFDEEPQYDCGPFLEGNEEACSLEFPPGGQYFIALHGFDDYAGVTLGIDGGGLPDAPSGSNVVAVSATGLRPSWVDNSHNEVDFQLQRGQFVSGVWSGWSTVARPTAGATHHVDEGLTPNGVYRYRVRA